VAVSPNVAALLAARAVLGLACGVASLVVPMYISELAPADHRGTLVTVDILLIVRSPSAAAAAAPPTRSPPPSPQVTGQLVACCVNLAILDLGLSPGAAWRTGMGLAAAPAVVQLCGFAWLPESPRWLASVGQRDAAVAVLARVRGLEADDPAVVQEAAAVFADVAREAGGGGGGESALALYLRLWRKPALRRAFRLGIGIMCLQQMVGINTIMYYGATLLERSGFGPSDALALTIGLAAAQGLGIVLGMRWFDSRGRRPMLLGSCAALAAALVAVAGCEFGAAAAGSPPAAQDRYRTGAVVGVVLYLVSFGFAMSSGPWIVNSEIYPIQARGVGTGQGCVAIWLANFAVSMAFLPLADALGMGAVFLLLAGVAVAGAAWLYAALPETRGKSLEEVAALFEGVGDAAAAPLISDGDREGATDVC